MINWCIQEIPIKQLKENKKNPRKLRKELAAHLEKNLDNFGLIDKPVVNLDFTIIGGHQRVRILKKRGVVSVPCWTPDRQLSEDEVNNLCVNLNLHQGEWDWDILANEWEPLDLLEWGFTEQQLLGLTKEAEEILEKEKKAAAKKCCPNCGHEF